MKLGSRRKNEEKPKEEKKTLRVVQSTQKNIPIKDFANGTIITENKKLLKIVEVTPIPFQTLKANQKNQIRERFERMIKTGPSQMQIKCIATPADLTKQITQVEENLEKEKNMECLQLTEEYIKKLKQAQEYNVERKFYIIFPNEDSIKKKKTEELSKQIYSLNTVAKNMCQRLKACDTQAKPLNNNEIASLFYTLLNRNSYKDILFEDHYIEIYDNYVEQKKIEGTYDPTQQIYVPPTEYIAPKALYFNDRQYVMCDDRYYTYLYLDGEKGYPTSVPCGWLDMFVSSFEGIDVDIFIKKKDRRRFKDKLLQTIGHSKRDMGVNFNDVSDSFQNASSKYESARFLYYCLMHEQSIYDVSVIITVSGGSIEEVNEKAEQIIDTAKGYDMRLRTLPYEAEQAFVSTLPLCNLDPNIEKKSKRNVPQISLSTFFPFTAFQLIHDKGLLIADGFGQTPVIPDFWKTSFVSNSLIFMCGMAGAGKTSALELIACHARVRGKPVFIVAPEKQDDYVRLCEDIGGQFIYIGPGSPYRINIMEIFENSKNTLGEEVKDYYGKSKKGQNSYMNLRVDIVFDFLHINYPTMNQKEQGVLRDCILEAYRQKGITEDNESLWADKEKTHYKQMPIIADLLPLIKQKGSDMDTLYYNVKQLTEGAGAHFNGQTNIDVNNRFFVIGTESSASIENRTMCAFLAEDFCQMKIREDRVTQTVYIIDEGWQMLSNEYTSKKMFEDSKILRGYQCLFIFGSQQMADVLSTENGRVILNNAETRIIMKHKDEDIKYISSYIDLSESERKMIRDFDVGQALMLANQVRIPIYFNPTEFEKLLTWNDPATLERYYEYRKQRDAMFEAQERKNRARNRRSVLDYLTGEARTPKVTITDSRNYLKQMKEQTPAVANTAGYVRKMMKGKEAAYDNQ